MKYFPIVWSGLWRRPVRTVLTVLSVVTAFFLFGVLQGINAGVNSAFDLLNVSRLRVMSRVSMNEPLPFAHLARIRTVPGVVSATPLNLVIGTYQQPTQVIPVIGVEVEELLKIYAEEMQLPADQKAAMLRTRNGALVGGRLAERFGWKVGDRIPLTALAPANRDGTKNWVFDIAGIYEMDERGWATNMFVNYDYVNEARADGKDRMFQVILRVGDASKSGQVAQQIDEMFANSPNQTSTQNEKDFIQGVLAQIGDISFLVNAIVGAVLFALLFLTANTMMQSVRERIPELAVLKTLGFSYTSVLVLVLVESLLLSVFAALVGLLAARALIPAAMSRMSTDLGAVVMPDWVFAWGAVMAVVLAIVSGMPPALRAGRLKIVDALAGR
jgi:putative ABC transport system permease protein